MRTDNELIKEFQEGKEAAFNELVDRYLSSTYGFFTKFTDSKEEAEDLAQDVFIKMYKALKKFRFESEFKTYLYRANINMSNTYLRRNKWKNMLHLDQISEPEYIDTTNEDKWKRKELWDAIARLPKIQRMVVTMRTAENLPYKEIAKIMNISENSAKVNYYHAVEALKIFFEN
ncbi:MAG: sigma-70 family RNA polymerase sigma factor [Candidatus Neomarinimicrobiota bacterium]|jgi:RNA polymerase sigma-70 factor (ECF subfamily)|nr:sigma-70 family RNA polymerase sigma factor [Candidatus Neomarinimicrobiota bacterium]MEC7902249.1 sigma-70 family RNA polymerase sigma factor [Candidatus Neomarinimicrobiota bacterium]|tara:strand:- start:5363 stop:5884 length:522 start_codon:yes stop_codon:yes gene_type:complete